MSDTIIEFKSVMKRFSLQEDRTFKEFLPHFFLGRPWAKELTVFSDISLSIDRGEVVGIIGRNGSGKSTILKLIAGVTQPTKGEVIVRGKTAPLIEVGAGFHSELSGYENIFLHAAILGMHKKEIESRVDKIIEFSELRDFIHTPVKKYSTGMYMRLGFSIAVYTNAPILLIDEVLAVGDEEFQKKCLKKLEELRHEFNTTIVFVSHDQNSVEKFCDRVILLNKGKLIFSGTPSSAFAKYHKLIEAEE